MKRNYNQKNQALNKNFNPSNFENQKLESFDQSQKYAATFADSNKLRQSQKFVILNDNNSSGDLL